MNIAVDRWCWMGHCWLSGFDECCFAHHWHVQDQPDQDQQGVRRMVEGQWWCNVVVGARFISCATQLG
jgi:hypothetical protein